MIIILGILLLGITACAQDFAASPSADEQMQKKNFYQQIIPQDAKLAKETYQAPPAIPPTITPPAEVKKQTEAECEEQWKKLTKDASKVLKFSEGSIRVSFKSNVELAEAVVLLEKYAIEKEKIVGIFVQPNESEEQQFKNSKDIIGSVEEGKEIEIACKILQESVVQGAYPEVTLGFVSK